MMQRNVGMTENATASVEAPLHLTNNRSLVVVVQSNKHASLLDAVGDGSIRVFLAATGYTICRYSRQAAATRWVTGSEPHARTRLPLETATVDHGSQKRRTGCQINQFQFQFQSCVQNQAERGEARQRPRDPGRGRGCRAAASRGAGAGTGRQRDQYCGREGARAAKSESRGGGWGTSSGGDPCDFADQFEMEEGEEAGHGTHLRSCRACDAAVAAPPPRRRW